MENQKREGENLEQQEVKKVANKCPRIPIGRPSVENMIKHKLYADKTEYISNFFDDEGTYYFFTRPRRFGKSLLIDTIDQIAKGNKALFEHCYIGNPKNGYDWKKYPVIKLNFSELNCETSEGLEIELKYFLSANAAKYGIKELKAPTLNTQLDELIMALGALEKQGYQNKVIVLIDEYDSPLISCEKEQYEKVLSVLSSFFKVLKSCQPNCKFIFMTGVTKFHLAGIGSGANSMNDISLDESYAEMLGYTEDDIDNLFFEGKTGNVNAVIESLKIACAKESDYTAIQLKQDLRAYYNGYCFARNGTKVYNPDSILRFFDKKDFKNYWFHTGDPSILVQQMAEHTTTFTDFDWRKKNFLITQQAFEDVAGSIDKIKLLPLMYQTGYLTIDPDGYKEDKNPNKNASSYYLKCPNTEVGEALERKLEENILESQEKKGADDKNSLLQALFGQQWENFLNIIAQDGVADASYMFLDGSEYRFQGHLYAFFKGATLGSNNIILTQEDISSNGRSDITIVHTDNNCHTAYIFELKVNKSSQEALQQIDDKQYCTKYFSQCDKVFAIGLNYTYQKKDKNNASSYRNLTGCSIGLRGRKGNMEEDRHFICSDFNFIENKNSITNTDRKRG